MFWKHTHAPLGTQFQCLCGFTPKKQKTYKLLSLRESKMPSLSKETQLLKLFFNFPTKHWHFTKLREEARISDAKLSKWLKKFVKNDIVIKIRPKGKMPYYIGNSKSPHYRNTKKLLALNELHECGLLDHLLSVKAETIIIFGSFSRWDWYDESDIDIFIFGDGQGFKPTKYEMKLHREIQIFHARNKNDLKRYSPNLIHEILNGVFIKGRIRSMGVKVLA